MRRYGKWAGNEKGTPERAEYCVVSVWPAGRWPVRCQCGKKRGHGPDGLYCAQHARMLRDGRTDLKVPDAEESSR